MDALSYGWFLFVVLMVTVYGFTASATDDVTDQSRRRRNLLKKDFRPPETEYGPRWTQSMADLPKVYMKLQHESVTLKCAADAKPRPQVTWLKDGRPITIDGQLQQPKYETSRFGLKIYDLMSPFDRGNYTCIVSNRLGSLNHTYTVDVVVRFIGPPHVTNGPKDQTVFEGEPVQMSCSYYSDMESLVYWLKHFADNGSYVDENGKGQTKLLQREDGNGSDDTEWVIAKAKPSDAGLYSCCATNAYGTTCRQARVQVNPGKRQSPSTTETGSVLVPYVLPVAIGLCLLVLVGALCLICIFRHRGYKKITFKDPDVVNPIYLNVRQTDLTKGLQIPFDEKWMIPEESIRVESPIGEGAFGFVYLGHLTPSVKGTSKASNLGSVKGASSQGDAVVAVKTLKESGTEEDLRCFLKEIETMKNIGSHINVIGFLGCCTRNGQLLMVVEFARHGNLRDFLRDRRNSSPPGVEPQALSNAAVDDVINRRYPPPYKLLVSFAYQVSRGLEYLASKSIVHRDVACRNVLLADDLVVKVADFGLTRIVEGQTPYYRSNSKDLLPIRWMSPESLTDNKYTTKSDVWSYGVLLWEIFSLGDVPYDSTPLENLHAYIRGGLRLHRPAMATIDMYRTMTVCWKYLPHERPTFRELVPQLEALLSRATASEYLLLDELPEPDVEISGSDEEVFEQHDTSTPGVHQDRVLPSSSRSGDSQYSSWSSDHTGSRLLPSPDAMSSR